MNELKISNDNLFDSNNLWKIKDWVREEVDIKKKIGKLCKIEHPKAISIIEEYLNKHEPIYYEYFKNAERHEETHFENNIPISYFQTINVDWDSLSSNSCAIELLKKNIENSKDNSKNYFCLISWKDIVFNKNPDIRPLIEENLDKVFSKKFFQSSMYVDLLEKYINKYYDSIDWDALSKNLYAINLLEKNQDKINWDNLSCNMNAIHLLEQNFDKINWDNLSFNENAIHLLEKNMDKINLVNLECNSNAVHLIEEHVKYTSYVPGKFFSSNPNALSYLRKNPQYINWEGLKFNTNYSEVAEMFENNFDKCDGKMPCLLAYHIYLRVKDKIDNNVKYEKFFGFLKFGLFLNNDIFELNYDFMKNRSDLIKKELIQKTWHPRRFRDWCFDIDELKVFEDLN